MLKKTTRIITGAAFLCLIIGLVFLSYNGLDRTFFIADEWWGLSQAMTRSVGQIFTDAIWGNTHGVHYVPLGGIMRNFVFQFFQLNMAGYAYTGLIFHLINVSLFFWLIRKVTGRFVLSGLAAILFALSPLASQAITWFSTNSTTLPCVTLLLVSLLFFTNFLAKRTRAIYFILALVFVFLSVFSKEYSIFLFVFYAVFLVFSNRRRSIPWKKTWVWPAVSIACFIGYLGFRYFRTFLFPTESIHMTETVFATHSLGGSLLELLIKWFVTPLQSFWMIILSPEQATEIATNWHIPVWAISVLVLAIVLICYIWLRRSQPLAKLLPGIVVFSLLAFTPFAFRNYNWEQIEQRYLYIPLLGGCFLLIILADSLISFFIKKQWLKYIILAAIIGGITTLNIATIKNGILDKQEIGDLRSAILRQIKSEHPDLSANTIFLFQGNSSGFYGLADYPIPFQSGIGNVLLSWYHVENSELRPYLSEFALYSVGKEVLVEKEDSLFGVFYSGNSLTDYLLSHPVSPETKIIAYFYDCYTKKLSDHSLEWQVLVNFEEKNLAKIDTVRSVPGNDASILIDGGTENSWESVESYNPGQWIELELEQVSDINRVDLNVPLSAAENSFAVGYKVETSLDGETWEKIVERRRAEPLPGENKTIITFPEKKAKMIRITQLGLHGAAPWSLSEIEIFKTNQ